MTIAKIENGVVTQVDHSKSEAPAGWVVAPESVVVGQIDNGDGTFSNPKPTVSRVADDKVAELKTACRDAIFAGFNTDALSTGMLYPAKQGGEYLDQTNLIAQHSSALNNSTRTYMIMCRDPSGVWARREHTSAQTIQVGETGVDFVEGKKNYLDTKLAEVSAVQNDDTLTDEEKRTQINAITW